MSIENALASVAVTDLDVGAAWYGTLLGLGRLQADGRSGRMEIAMAAFVERR